MDGSHQVRLTERFGQEVDRARATVRYLGIEVEDALEMAEQTEV